ncbi:bacteriocin-like protein [Chryseobacterium lactis]|uniref:bacteriocin-like protein n=1 Tax=Chryseobacterium lactis TaxID=1241981 RepID=UPI0013DD98AA|nr:hypothetical protein [Chryseobacterium lactis]
MKNLKRINRENLKSISGGRPPAGSDCEACGCPAGTTVCYYKNGNGGGGGCGDVQCVR